MSVWGLGFGVWGLDPLLAADDGLGPCSSPMPRVLGGWVFSYERGTPVAPNLGKQILGNLEEEIQTHMAQDRSTKIILIIEWMRSSGSSIKNSPSLSVAPHGPAEAVDDDLVHPCKFEVLFAHSCHTPYRVRSVVNLGYHCSRVTPGLVAVDRQRHRCAVTW